MWSLSINKLRRFDAHSKPLEELSIKTLGGGVLTIVSIIFIVLLSISEYKYYTQTQVNQKLFVDITRGQKLNINLDIVFHRIGCQFLTVHAMDVSGEHQSDVEHTMVKQRLNRDGTVLSEMKAELVTTLTPGRKPCGSCYGAETPARNCCNSCADIDLAYRERGWVLDRDSVELCRIEAAGKNFSDEDVAKEGCRLHGFLTVNKVAGNIHISPGSAVETGHVHVHDIRDFRRVHFNTSLTIRSLSFGENYPGMVNPLDGVSFNSNTSTNMFSYYVKVVPTTYVSLNGSVQRSNQFSVTKHRTQVKENAGGIPGMVVVYEISPILVSIVESRKSFMHFVTSLCAIVGGVYTVSSLADAFFYHSFRAIRRKMEMGKFS